MVVTLLGIVTEVKLVPEKASVPIETKSELRVTETNCKQFLYAESGMEVYPAGITTVGEVQLNTKVGDVVGMKEGEALSKLVGRALVGYALGPAVGMLVGNALILVGMEVGVRVGLNEGLSKPLDTKIL